MSVETEQQYLGGLFLMALRDMNVSDIASQCHGLSIDDFNNNQHKAIFKAVKNRADRGQTFDTVLIIEDCKDHVDFRYVMELARNASSTANIAEYKRIIRSNSIRRHGMGLAQHIGDMIANSGDPVKALGNAETMIQELMGKAQSGGGSFTHIREMLSGYIDEIESRLSGSQDAKGLTSGMPTIDGYLEGGFQPGSLIVMGGRPGMGKTAMMLSLIKGMAEQMSDRAALAFSLEMSLLQLSKRYATFYTGLSYSRMIEDMQRDPDGMMWAKLSQMVEHNASLPIYMADAANLTVEQLCADVRAKAREGKIGLVAVDYLGLMNLPKAERTDLSIGKLTRALKSLAMELGCVVLLLAQLNRGVESRDNKRPRPSDFRDSGAIEQDADYIITLYRDFVYNEESVMGNIGEVDFCKNRHGAPFKVYMDFKLGNWIDDCDQATAHNLYTQSLAKPMSHRRYAKGLD